jgi:hypothetical protein
MSCALKIQTLPIVTLTKSQRARLNWSQPFQSWTSLLRLGGCCCFEDVDAFSPPRNLQRRDFALHAGGVPYLTHFRLPNRPSLIHLLALGFPEKVWVRSLGDQSCTHGARERYRSWELLGNWWCPRSSWHPPLWTHEITISHVGPGLVSPADIRRTPHHMILWGL